MASAEEYRRQVAELMGCEIDRKGKIKKYQYRFTGTTPQQLTAEIVQMQKELRLIKKNIDIEIKNIRTYHNNRLTQVHPGIGAMLILGKGSAKSIAATKKKNIRADMQNAINPYESVKHFIDATLVELDGKKVQLSSI